MFLDTVPEIRSGRKHMPRPAAIRPSAPQGRRAGLDHDEVVDHALALVVDGGPDALTMRKLAAELNVTPTTIYWHVGSRDEVVAAVIDRVAASYADAEVEGATPRDRVMSLARTVWEMALTNRNVTSLAHQSGATNALEVHLERAMARELEAAGLSGGDVRDALRAILMCVAGFLVVAFRLDGGSNALRGHRSAEGDDSGLSADTMAAMAEAPDLPVLFDKTVQAVIDSFVPDDADAASAATTRKRAQ
ncbi:MAG: TetR/AcrR family transcriptional regulator [Actinomycetes bacterium]